MHICCLFFAFVDEIWSHFPQMLFAPVHQLRSSLPHNQEATTYILHVDIISLPPMFLLMQTSTFVDNYPFATHKTASIPCSPAQCAGLLWFYLMQQWFFMHWPKWLCEMHACDQSAVACWSSLFPDIVHSPQAPATDNGSLCQTAWGGISSRMLGVLCWLAAIKWSSVRHSVQTEALKGIRFAERVMQTSLLIAYHLQWDQFFFSSQLYSLILLCWSFHSINPNN